MSEETKTAPTLTGLLKTCQAARYNRGYFLSPATENRLAGFALVSSTLPAQERTLQEFGHFIRSRQLSVFFPPEGFLFMEQEVQGTFDRMEAAGRQFLPLAAKCPCGCGFIFRMFLFVGDQLCADAMALIAAGDAVNITGEAA